MSMFDIHINGDYSGGGSTLRADLADTSEGKGFALISITAEPGEVGVVNPQYPPGHIRRYGTPTDGASPEDAAWDNCIAFCKLSGRQMVLEAGRTYKLTTPKTIDYTKHGIDGKGAILDFSSLTSGAAITIGYQGTGGDLVWRSRRFRIQGIEIVGPGSAIPVTGISISDTSGLYAGQVNLESVVIRKFSTGITFGNNAYLFSGLKVEIYNCATVMYYPNGLTNSGERVTFIESNFFNSTQLFDLKGGVYLLLNSCSLDYFANFAVNAEVGAKAVLNQCHIEAKSDGDAWFKTKDSMSSIHRQGCALFLAGNRTKYIDSASNANAGITVDSEDVGLPSTSAYALDTFGTGNCLYSNPRRFARGQPYHVHVYGTRQNMLSDGGFESGNALLEWDTSAEANNDPPTIDTTTANSGNNSLKLTTSAPGRKCVVSKTWPVVGGAKPTLLFYTKQSFTSPDDTLTVTLRYNKADGTPVHQVQLSYSQAGSNFSTFTRQKDRPASSASGGAVEFEVVMELNNVGGTSTAWIDDMILEGLDGVQQVPRKTL